MLPVGSLPELHGHSMVEVVALEDDGHPIADRHLRGPSGGDALEGSIKAHLQDVDKQNRITLLDEALKKTFGVDLPATSSATTALCNAETF